MGDDPRDDGPWNHVNPFKKSTYRLPGSPEWQAARGPNTPGRSGKISLVFGIIIAVAGWIALATVNNQAPDSAGMLGAHRVLKNYGALHTLSIGVIVVGVALALFGIMRMAQTPPQPPPG